MSCRLTFLLAIQEVLQKVDGDLIYRGKSWCQEKIIHALTIVWKVDEQVIGEKFVDLSLALELACELLGGDLLFGWRHILVLILTFHQLILNVLYLII